MGRLQRSESFPERAKALRPEQSSEDILEAIK